MALGDRYMIGELLERRYRLDAPIAQGGMSTVFRGLDIRLDRPVAIKVMDPKFAADPQFVARFEFEARAVARLKHPGLVAVYDQGHDRSVAFLVMELVEGGTLRELFRERGPMPPHAVRAVAEPVLDALGVAHAAGLVHRDVKPENVLISDSGEVKLADFGLVRAVASSTTTSSSVILGTAAYLSPEQVETGAADERSDVYSMGVLMFEMLTGRTPFTGDTTLAIAYQRLNHDVPEPSRFIPGVPPELDALVLQATDRDPARRFANGAAMASALRHVAAVLQLPPYRVPAPKQSAEHLSAQYRRPAVAPHADPAGPTSVMAAPATQTLAASPMAPHQPAAPQHTRVVTAQTGRASELPPPPDEFDDAADRFDNGGHYPGYIEDRHRSRRNMAIWLILVLLLAAAVGVGGWWMGSGRYTAVPAIDGLDRATATAAISNAGLSTAIGRKPSDTVPMGGVIGTDPTSGARVTRDSTVTLLLSLGRPKVPGIGSGDAVAVVKQRITEASLQPVDGGEAFSPTAPIGTVAVLDPMPGTEVAVNSPVKVFVSKGAPPVNLPELAGKTVDDAKAALTAAGITVRDTKQTFDEDIDAGRVIGTDPKAGTSVLAGSEVTLLVSNSVKMPSLLGHSVGSARDQLSELGLDVRVRQMSRSDRSIVISQSEDPGARLKPGSKVDLISLP